MAKAIVVDDSKFMRTIIKDVIKSMGHEILAEADNGTDGIEAYRQYRPDFITMDITMGGMDGMNAVNEIRGIDPASKIIIISALNETVIRSMDNSVSAAVFLTKPFEKEALMNAVNTVISSGK